MQRYIPTIQLAIYADSDEQAKEKANNLIKHLQSLSDNDAEMIELHEMPYGSMKGREIKI